VWTRCCAARLTEARRAELDTRGTLLDEPRAARLVRRCHGDLPLRNICYSTAG
jgi:aminoglycoside phosphotransferase family enzyme